MTGPSESGTPSLMARRYAWLLSELHAGNEFSQDQLWRWLKEAEAEIRSAEAVLTPSAI